jgi:hypothetical protein
MIAPVNQGDSVSDEHPDGQASGDAAPPALTPASRRSVVGILTVLAVLVTCAAILGSVGLPVVVGIPLEVLAVSLAVAVVGMTRGKPGAGWGWLLLAFALVPVALTVAYFATTL